jgi:hypothetical protein
MGGYLTNEKVGIRPQVGTLVFDDVNGDSAARAAYGLTVDVNLASAINENLMHWYLGPSTGAIYSHLGSPGAGFFGTDQGSGLSGGANLLLIPANLKVGYNFNDYFRVAAHGGGNVVYRSIANSMFLSTSSVGGGSDWTIFPNVGADVEVGLGRNLALTLRPDVTITPENDILAATLALAIPIG